MDKFLPSFLSSNPESEENSPAEEQMSDGSSNPPATRSRTNLAAPNTRHQAQLQARRSPSPSSQDRFFPTDPETATMATPPILSVDDIVKIATASAQAAAKEFAAAANATTPDVSLAASQSIKKVELPTFDKRNIHVWIRRVEAAFGRAGVTQPQDKFFFIESKIDVNLNPKINEFLCGDSTERAWNDFLLYLKEEYGKTKEQQASAFLNGIPRDGLRPSQHLAKIRDLVKDITLDDLIKEMVLKDLPGSVRQALAERTTLTADEAAKAADHHFDKEGRPKHEPNIPKVNNVDETPASTNQEDDTEQINAIGNRAKKNFTPAFVDNTRSQQPTRSRNYAPDRAKRNFTPAFSDNTRSRQPTRGRNYAPDRNRSSNPQRICRHHTNFGDRAYNCEPGCQYRPQQNQSAAMSGNGAAGRRR